MVIGLESERFTVCVAIAVDFAVEVIVIELCVTTQEYAALMTVGAN